MSLWAVPSLIAVVVLAWLSLYVVVRKPPSNMKTSVQLALFAPLLFCCGDLLTHLVTDPGFAWAPVALLYSGIMFVPPTWWLLAHRFAEAHHHPFRWSRRKGWINIPFVVAAVLWLGMMTNPWHGQFLTQHIGARNEYHWMWWVYTIISYALVLATVGLFLRLVLRVQASAQRTRIHIMLAAALLNVAANLVYLIGGDAIPFDLTTTGFVGSGILFLVGIYRIGLFSINPVAVETILENQPNGILVTDLQGKLLYWNPAAEQMLHQSLSAVEQNVYAFLGERLMPTDKSNDKIGEQALRQALANHGQRKADILYRYQADGEHWLAVWVVEMPSRRGMPIGYSFQLEDHTQRRREEIAAAKFQDQVELAQKTESLGLLAGGVAHDFNNLLLAIRGNAELVRADLEDKPNAIVRIEQIEQATERAARLTQQLLSYAGKASTERHRLNLSELVQSTAELLQTAVLPKGLVLDLDFNLAEEVWLQADQTQIEQVLMNLVINAAEASSDDHRVVTISTGTKQIGSDYLAECMHGGSTVAGKFAYFAVRDSGHGISPESVRKIFDPFFTTKGLGHGLGLAAVLGIVRTHHGALHVQSRLAGGSTFRVFFPIEG